MRRVPREPPHHFRKKRSDGSECDARQAALSFSLGKEGHGDAGGVVMLVGFSIKRQHPMNTVSWLRNGKQRFEVERSLCLHACIRAFGVMGVTNVQI